MSPETVTIVGDDEGFLVRQALEVAALLGWPTVVRDNLPAEAGRVFVAASDGAERERLLAALPADRSVSLVHPSAVVSVSATLGRNVYIGSNAVVGMNAVVGDGVVQNALSSIEHDNRIGAFTMLGTGAILCGHVTTGEHAFIGGGAVIKPGTTVGARTTVGTGAVLIRDADADSTYVGNPARRLG